MPSLFRYILPGKREKNMKLFATYKQSKRNCPLLVELFLKSI